MHKPCESHLLGSPSREHNINRGPDFLSPFNFGEGCCYSCYCNCCYCYGGETKSTQVDFDKILPDIVDCPKCVFSEILILQNKKVYGRGE